MKTTPKITSVKNPIVQRFCSSAVGDPPGVMVAEGVRLVGEALDAELTFLEAAYSSRLMRNEAGRGLRRRLREVAPILYECSDKVLERISSLDSSPGVSAVLRRPSWSFSDLLGDGIPLLVVVAGVRDPGNLGAVVRAAEAAGATGLMTLSGGADPYRDKALRGSAGSIFRLPTLSAVKPGELVELAAREGLQLVLAEVGDDGGGEYTEVDFRSPTALVLGDECGGIPEVVRTAAQAVTRVPMAAPVESLNVAVTAGILLYEVRRQRR